MQRNMKLKSFLCALLLMTSSMASAQYINIKMADGTYRSHRTTPNMMVSFGEKAGTEVIESSKMATVNGHTVTVKLADDIPENDVALNVYVEGEAVKIKAVSALNKDLMCIWDSNVETPNLDVPTGFHTFTISDISKDMVATVEYNNPIYTVRFNMKGRGESALADMKVAYAKAFTAPTPTAANSAFWCWCTDEDCTTPFDFSKGTTTDITLYAKWMDGINGHAYVELAGYKWATENVGDCGFDSGEAYTQGHYYYVYSKVEDAAKSWGSESDHNWVLPSREQWEKLKNECHWEWTASYSLRTSPDYGKPGYIVYQTQTGSNNGYSPATVPHIFLPAAGGYLTNSSGITGFVHQNRRGYYWMIYNGSECLYFSSDFITWHSVGLSTDATSVRPVAQ